MLTELEISNFAIVSQLSIEWHNGMSTITGETGAGKSIAIDALSLCLGERAEAAMVRPGKDSAQICANFDISSLPAASKFLQEHQLNFEHECVIRRVINSSGRSKAYINGTLVSLNQLKTLAPMLVSIHGQHAHQFLTKAENQLSMLDNYANHDLLLSNVYQAYKSYTALSKELNDLKQSAAQQEAEKQLLQYQVAELDEFALVDGEYEEIEQMHARLSHSNTLMEQCHKELQVLYQQEGFNAFSIVQQSANQIASLADLDDRLTPIADLLFESSIQLEEAARELSQYQDAIVLDPSQLNDLESRMSSALDLARKHNVQPQQLAEHHNQLANQLACIEGNSERIEALESETLAALNIYQEHAQILSASRESAATLMAEKIESSMQQLAMENAQFNIEVANHPENIPNKLGANSVSFNVSTNPGQPLQALAKVASGGELSRISLAIEVLIANNKTTPTLIFDEVDVGISGPTATAVGRLLRELGDSTQVICVTHLPQVACHGHNQFFVEKSTDGQHTTTSMVALTEEGRIDEIARLLGGENISDVTRTNAKELLCQPI